MTSLMVSSTTDGRDELAEGISATPLAGTAFSSSAMASACCEIWRIGENWGRARLTGRKRPSESALSLSLSRTHTHTLPALSLSSLIAGRRSLEFAGKGALEGQRGQRTARGAKKHEEAPTRGPGLGCNEVGEKRREGRKGQEEIGSKKTPRVGRWTQGRDGGFGDAGGFFRPRFSDQRCSAAAADSLSGLF